MPRNKRNSIRIFWIENNKEKSVRIYPKNTPEMKWENGFELYHYGLTEVCWYFNCLFPDELMTHVEWCYDSIPCSDINRDIPWEERKKIYESDEYQYWLQLKIDTWCCEATDSMFSDAFRYLKEACKYHDNGEDVDEVHLSVKKWKDMFWVAYFFNEYIGNQRSYVPTGAWIFKDGSYITVEAGNHRRIVEEYMNLKESDVEKQWIKVQLYWAYTHKWMTSAQEKTLNKFFKKYDDLHESDTLWVKYGKDW